VVGVFAVVLLALAAYAFRVVFVPLILGTIIAYVLTPAVRLVKRLTRLGNGLATAVVYLLLLAVIIPAVVLLTPVFIEQLVALQRQVIALIRDLNAMGAHNIQIFGFELAVGDLVSEVSTVLLNAVRSAAAGLVGAVFNAARAGLLAVFTFVIAFYLTRDSEKVVAAIKGLVPPAYRNDAARLLGEIDAVWSAFLRGQVLLSLLVTAILTVVSALLGLPEPLLLGVWGGLLEFLPSIGNMIWGATAILLAILEGSTYLAVPPAVFVLLVIAAYAAFSQIDINVLIPTVIGGQVRLHPMIVLVGVIIGLSVGGVLGVALAAPTIASLRVIGRYIYAKLFGLEPFPMVGAPAAPVEEREAEAQRRAAELASRRAQVRVRRRPVRKPPQSGPSANSG
jgi:predicted PurR-regulated permease PerM